MNHQPPAPLLVSLAASLCIAGCSFTSTQNPPEPPPGGPFSPSPVAVNLPPASPVSPPLTRLPPGANAELPSARLTPGQRPPPPPSSSRLVATSPVPGQRIGSVDYVDATAFFARYGLRPAGPADSLRVIFQGSGSHLELTANDREMTLNNLRIYLGEPTQVRARAFLISRTDAERLLGPILAPAAIAGPVPPVPRIIALDPGHGGLDPGAVNPALGVNEKTFTLDVAQRLKPLLEAQGWQVVMTRTGDAPLSIYKPIDLPLRPKFANDHHADLFVSIHFNTVPGDSKTSGTEIYTFPPEFERSTSSWGLGATDDSESKADPSNRFDAWNSLLANSLHGAVLARLGTFDRGQKMAHFAVLKGLNCPGVLIESAFLSNDTEARKVATPAFRQQIAEGIAKGLAAYAAQLAELPHPK